MNAQTAVTGLHFSPAEAKRSIIAITSLLIAGMVLALLFQPAGESVPGYLPLHMLVETFAVTVAILVFSSGWHAFERNLPGNIVLLGVAFLGVGLLDFAHMISYAGMPDFVTPSSPEKGLAFWLAARFLAAIAMLAAVLMPSRSFSSPWTRYQLLAAVIAFTLLAYWLFLFHLDVMPRTFIPGEGLTTFKIASEYVFIALYFATAFALWRRMNAQESFHTPALACAAITMAISEFVFTRYTSVTDAINLLGHVYKIVAYLFLYRAVFLVAVEAPYRQSQTSQAKLSSTINTIPDLVWLKDANGVFLECNPAFERLYGTKRESIIGKTDYDFVSSNLADFFREHDRKAIAANKPTINEEWLTFADGYHGLFETIKSPMYDEAGSLIGVLGIARDITARKKAAGALMESEEKFRRLFEDTADPVLLLKEGRFIDCNAATLQLLGYATKEEFINSSPSSISPPYQPDGRSSAEKSAEMDATALQKGSNRFEWMHRRRDGADIPIEVTLTSIYVEGERILHVHWRDITERKEKEHKLQQARQAAQEAELRYRTVADFTYDWEAWIDVDGRWLYCSPSCKRITGHNADKFIANPQTFLNTVHPEDRDAVLSNFKEAFTKTGHGNTLSFRIEHKEGRIVWVEQTSQPVFDDTGQCIGYRTSCRDITERKQAEDKLRKLSLAVEQSPDSIVITNLDAKIEYVNAAFIRETGYSREDAIGQNPSILNSGKNPKKTYEEMWSRLMHGEVWRGELINRRKDGSEYIESVSISPVLEPNGKATHYLAIKENITGRKNDEIKIKRLSRIYRLLSQVNEAIVHSPDRSSLFRNICDGAMESGLFQLAWIGLAGKSKSRLEPITCSETGDSFISSLDICLEDEKCRDWPIVTAVRNDTVIIKQDMDELPHIIPWRSKADELGLQSVGIFPFHEAGAVVGSINVYAADKHFFSPDIIQLMQELVADVSFALDVFAEKKCRAEAEEEIRQINMELERRVKERTRELELVNKELEAFCYSVSHDLRTPLRGIDGFSQILLKRYHDQLDATGRDYLGRVCRGSQRMGQLIDDMLQLSQVTRHPFERKEIDLSSMAQEVADELQKAHPERRMRFTVQKDLAGYADQGLLRILMSNLLGNACKYTSKKEEAEIEFGMQAINGENVWFVRDNGAGFNMEYAHKLFGAFQRLHSTSEFEGTGIGLATVQRVIHRHHGRIWAEAEEGKGAVFYFTLPQRENGRQEEIARDQKQQDIAGGRQPR